jgi:hypothetical protein
MSKVQMVALEKLRYSGAWHFPGDRFKASGRDSRLLAAIGKATAAPVVVEPPKEPDKKADEPRQKRQYTRRDQTAGSTAGYQRRDMTAKD